MEHLWSALTVILPSMMTDETTQTCVLVTSRLSMYYVRISLLLAAPPQQFDIRLVGGTNKTEGRVEIFYNNEWGTVCDDIWDMKDATVVCRQLGYPVAIRTSTHAEFGEGKGPIHLDDVSCQGDEAMLSQCRANEWGTNNCNHNEDAGVVCSGKCNSCYISFTAVLIIYLLLTLLGCCPLLII